MKQPIDFLLAAEEGARRKILDRLRGGPEASRTRELANHSKLFPNGGPTNQQVKDLAILCDQNEPLERGQKTELARSLTKGNNKEANNLLAALRKQQNLKKPTVRKFKSKG